MHKNFFLILLGIITLILVIGMVFLVREVTPKGGKQVFEEVSITPENILKIK